MPTMKVTSSSAMRARDVSRPHDEHVAWAEETEAGAAGPTAARVAAAASVAGSRAAGGAGLPGAAGPGGPAAASVAAAASGAGSRAEQGDAAAPERSAGRRGRPYGMRRRRRGGGGGRG